MFKIVRCTGCDLLITNPRPTLDALSQFYKSADYLPHQERMFGLRSALYQFARRFTMSWKRQLAHTYWGTGRLLDYGCGTGIFLSAMLQEGWNVEGLETDSVARSSAEHAIGKPLHSDPATLTGPFDLVTLWHVLEHLPQPDEVLKALLSKLAATGRIFIALPNYLAYDAEVYKEYWAGYDLPRHLWHFSPASMTSMLRLHGLELVRTIPMKLDAYYVSLLSESYLRKSFMRQYFSALRAASRSNRLAQKTGNYSSLLYIAKRRTS
jgi:2-polyprenyl-3-methyl-5-hydroxy-6-metoxy-1,4-benzoquinol methylase